MAKWLPITLCAAILVGGCAAQGPMQVASPGLGSPAASQEKVATSQKQSGPDTQRTRSARKKAVADKHPTKTRVSKRRQSDLKKLVAGRTFRFTRRRNGQRGAISFASNGSFKWLGNDGRGSGKWWIKDGKFCRRFTSSGQDQTLCQKLQVAGNNFSTDGASYELMQ